MWGAWVGPILKHLWVKLCRNITTTLKWQIKKTLKLGWVGWGVFLVYWQREKLLAYREFYSVLFILINSI